MVLIKDTVVSLDILEKYFCCDLNRCKGACCIEGDAGAPVMDEERQQIEELLPQLLPLMQKQARELVEKEGVCCLDKDGEQVTQIIDGKDCVFSRTDSNGWCYCLIEKLFLEGKSSFRKPISCYLYPIRVKEFPAQGNMPATTALDYHRWDICHPARQCGKKLRLPMYVFLKEPLIARFGQEWYDELCLTAEQWNKMLQ